MHATKSITLLAFFLTTSLASASILITFTYDSSNTVLSYEGTWDSYTVEGSVPGEYTSISAAQGPRSMDGYSYSSGGIDTPYPWSPSGVVPGGNRQGDSFGFSPAYVFAPYSYVAGTSIAGSVTFFGTSLEDLGLVAGSSGVLSGNGNTVNWNVVQVPEPATTVLFSGIAGLGLLLIRRRKV